MHATKILWFTATFKRYCSLILFGASAALIIMIALHFTMKASLAATSQFNREDTPAAPALQPTPTATSFVPFLHVIPNADDEITISLDNRITQASEFFANIKVGPTGSKGSWTLPYSTTAESYVRAIPFVSANTIEASTVNITTTSGLSSADIQFKRAFVKAQPGSQLESSDTRLKLELNNAATLERDTYMIVTTNRGQPGPLLPTTLKLLGSSYSIRAAGQLAGTPKPMTLLYRYADVIEDADPRTLDLYYWNPSETRWQPLHAANSLTSQTLSATTDRFGTFALMADAAWQADFSDFTLPSMDGDSLDQVIWSGVPGNYVLALENTPGVGHGVSIPITPRFGLAAWETIYFTATTAAPTATLSVDILGMANDEPILHHVVSGQSLAAIDVAEHPALRLRVNMTATAAGALPVLHGWRVTWQPPRPAVLQGGSAAIDLGGTITVPIELVDVPTGGLRGFALAMQYDPTLLQPEQCTITVPAMLPPVCNLAYPINSDGLASVRFNLIASSVITAPRSLGTITFRALNWAEAGALLPLGPALVTDAAGVAASVVLLPGRLTFTSNPSGDVNCDQQTDQTDALTILDYDAGLRSQSIACPPPDNTLFILQCDVTGDGACDLRDAQLILRE